MRLQPNRRHDTSRRRALPRSSRVAPQRRYWKRLKPALSADEPDLPQVLSKIFSVVSPIYRWHVSCNTSGEHRDLLRTDQSRRFAACLYTAGVQLADPPCGDALDLGDARQPRRDSINSERLQSIDLQQSTQPSPAEEADATQRLSYSAEQPDDASPEQPVEALVRRSSLACRLDSKRARGTVFPSRAQLHAMCGSRPDGGNLLTGMRIKGNGERTQLLGAVG